MAETSRASSLGISPITRRILAVNVGALLILGFGLLYSGQYERELIETELRSLSSEGYVLAAALAEGGVRDTLTGEPSLAEDLSRHFLRKLSRDMDHRAIIFSKSGDLILDTHQMMGPSGMIDIVSLPPPVERMALKARAEYYGEKFLELMPTRISLPRYPAINRGGAQDYPGVIDALSGETRSGAWRDQDGRILLTASIPIQSLKNVQGALLLVSEGHEIDAAVHAVHFTVIRLFLFALLVTLLLSVYLSETIARPIMRLAQAAGNVRHSLLLKDGIPDFSWRRDEIGVLSIALREMTYALSERIDAIGNFAADVAHEIKNPLASVQSAVETLPMVKDEAQRQKLLTIIHQDVRRMNRLITDISNVSRLDADISRAEKTALDVEVLLRDVIAAEISARGVQGRILLDIGTSRRLVVTGNAIQLGQVLHNLVDNALSFVSARGAVRVFLGEEGDKVMIYVENDGIPLPEDKLETIFERFYSERPKAEKFGLHSGLGLSISRQIVRAHQGSIFAQNIKDAGGAHRGVRFTILLPKGTRA